MAFEEAIPGLTRRAFGVAPAEVSAIGVGTWNATYRVTMPDREPVVLRIAPPGEDAMRNEHAAAPFFAGLTPLVPRLLFTDFTHEVVDRDYMFQSLLPGTPASALDAYPPHYFRQLGEITRRVHAVAGTDFGRVLRPHFATWSESLVVEFAEMGDRYDTAGLDRADVDRVIEVIRANRAEFDEVAPRLLHGDLWSLNLLVDADVNITGVLDWDTASWGDPYADWTIHQALGRPEAADFWTGYGPPPPDRLRQRVYRARALAGARLDIHRRDIDLATVPARYWDLSTVI